VSTVPATPAAEPVFSTWTAEERHLPAETRLARGGMQGTSVCGWPIYDQGALNFAYAGYGPWAKPAPRLTDLPLCTKCERKASA
jgi:hypothetical protein